ncbi:hypothetical protein [Polaromonas naphthalenivorans]|uniref:hypothetical protein n=1 Tax=Polaromonas naphthalenivorans TaxID=216465 RepID=UPI0012ECC919|nr:hypothetical protein [Polaromonas naphthalenivorans]
MKATYLKLKAHALLLREEAQVVCDQDRESYLTGYIKGLSRQFHGEVYEQDNHVKFLSYTEIDPTTKGSLAKRNFHLGNGYKDGLTAKPIGHGGPGRDQGRPAEMENGKRVNVYLSVKDLELASTLGNGNVSAGIRLALKKHPITHMPVI